MDIGRIIGTIVATQKVTSLEGSALFLLQPLNEKFENAGTPLVVSDSSGRRGVGEVVYFVASGDAVYTGPGGQDIPVDAAIVGIVDSIYVAEDR